jgi:hypothetical protein
MAWTATSTTFDTSSTVDTTVANVATVTINTTAIHFTASSREGCGE